MPILDCQGAGLASNGVSLTYDLQGLTAGSAEYTTFIKKLGIVERFKGDIYESLLLPTRLSKHFDQLDITVLNNQVVLNTSAVEASFKTAIAANPKNGIIDLMEFLSAAGQTRLQNLGWQASIQHKKWMNTYKLAA